MVKWLKALLCNDFSLIDDIGKIPGFPDFRMLKPGMNFFHFFETGDSISPFFIAYFLFFLFDF